MRTLKGRLGDRLAAAKDAAERIVQLGEGIARPDQAERVEIALVEGAVERFERGRRTLAAGLGGFVAASARVEVPGLRGSF